MKHKWQQLTELTAGKPVAIERVRIAESGVVIEGEFDLPQLALLSAEDQVFVAAFVRCHGSIKQMEKYFGVSYPTIKSRLNRIGEQLDFVEVVPVPEREEILQRVERGELAMSEALRMLRQEEHHDNE